MAWFGIWFGTCNACGGMWSNVLGQKRETDKDHEDDCVEEGFRLARVKSDRNG